MMGRSRVTEEDFNLLRARAMANAFAPKRAPKSPRNAFAPKTMERATAKVVGMMRSGDWDEATPRDFVALYELCHGDVYKVPVEGMTSVDRQRAALAAGKMLREQFAEDGGAMANFFRWVWDREKGREKWRRENGQDGGYIGWRLQFNGQLITQYRIALARKGQALT